MEQYISKDAIKQKVQEKLLNACERHYEMKQKGRYVNSLYLNRGLMKQRQHGKNLFGDTKTMS